MTDYLFLASGFVLLILGGEMLVRGAVDVAKQLGMSPLLIGITLVGFGTSAPELVTSVQASIAGSPGIAVGNIVGSCIANILLIVGVAAIIMPLTVHAHSLRRDGAIVLLSALAFMVLSFTYPLDRMVGAGFVLGLLAYLTYAYVQEMKLSNGGHTAAYDKGEAAEEVIGELNEPTPADKVISVPLALAMAVAGLVIIIFGGKLLVDGAVGIARTWGVSETVIGLTIVAVGTSMPELVTSVIAAIRKHTDVAVGNVLGSNIYNILGIGGVTGLIAPTEIPTEIVYFDNPVMVAASVLLLAFAFIGGHVSRVQGFFLLACYATYLYVLIPKSPAVETAASLAL